MELRGFEDSPEKERAQRAARQQQKQEQQQRDRAKKQAASEEAEAAKKEPQMQQQGQRLSSVEEGVASMEKYFNPESCNPYWQFSGIENSVANFLWPF